MVMFLFTTIGMAQEVMSHVVERGETLESIAQKYGVTTAQIRETNPEISDFFYVGMKLTIPILNQDVQPRQEVETKVYSNEKLPETILDNEIQQNTTEQVVYKQLPSPTQSVIEDGFVEGEDYLLILRPKDKVYGFHYGANANRYLYLATDISYCFLKGAETGNCLFGIGAGGKYKVGPLLLQGSLYPYAGGYFYSTPEYKTNSQGKVTESSKTKDKFTYGVSANIGAGVKIFESKSGKGFYLTVGYYCSAPEFETQDMLKYGDWMIGLTIAM